MEATPLLLVDDEAAGRMLLADYLEKQSFKTVQASSGEEALLLYQQSYTPVALIDLQMPAMNGMELLSRLRELNPFVQVIVLTAFGSVDTAVAAMRAGAHDFLTKPVQDLDELVIRLRRASQQNGLLRRQEIAARAIEAKGGRNLSGDSASIEEVRRLISLAGPSDSTVLITGESGTGKEVVARSLHSISNRSHGPFVAINAAAFPDSLLESELFGHEKGAFTGADRQKAGHFELAMHGTLFLDEIAEIPPQVQVKLLRVLETRSLQRLGSGKEIPLDLRVIAATNKNLDQEIAAGRFREDLYYRLNVVLIDLPPLRQRGGDILLLARDFLDRLSSQMGKSSPTLSSSAAAMLMAYRWPGNVRELQNVMQRALIFCEGKPIEPEHLTGITPVAAAATANEPNIIRRLDELEKEAIASALRQLEWNMAETADLLGIHRNTLRNKIKEYGLS